MKIVSVLGSPRKNGNSVYIANKIMDMAEEKGYEKQSFYLNDLVFKGCQACLACKHGAEECVIKDDLKPALEAVKNADILIMASPIYFGEVSGQLKCFIDRTYSFLKPNYLTDKDCSRLAPGKKVVFVLTQGQPDGTLFGNVVNNLDRFFTWYGYQTSPIRGLGLSAPDAASKDEYLNKEVERVTKALLNSN